MMDMALSLLFLNHDAQKMELLIIDDESQPEDVAAYQQYESQESCFSSLFAKK